MQGTKFQSAPPHGGRRGTRRTTSTSGGFNPRPRTGGDVRRTDRYTLVVHVSIRAPARGATRPRGSHLRRVHVSIRAPARGATQPARQRQPASRFQSAPPHGGRPGRPGRPADDYVSIRAPARGARHRAAHRCGRHVSIRAPARGATRVRRRRRYVRTVSIRAPARGATTGVHAGCRTSSSFNPRPRTGGDPVPGADDVRS